MDTKSKYIIRSRMYHAPILRVDVSNWNLTVRVTFTDGSIDLISFNQANQTITVNGVPMIDWYAKLN